MLTLLFTQQFLTFRCVRCANIKETCNVLRVTTDVRQPRTNYVNNGNKHVIVGVDVCSEYSNIRHLHLIIGKAQKFVSSDKYDF